MPALKVQIENCHLQLESWNNFRAMRVKEENHNGISCDRRGQLLIPFIVFSSRNERSRKKMFINSWISISCKEITWVLDWLTQALSVTDVGSETGYENAINTLIYVHTRYFMFIGVMIFIWNKLLIKFVIITMFILQHWLNKHFNYLVLLPYGLLDCESSVGDIKDRNVSFLIIFSFVVF